VAQPCFLHSAFPLGLEWLREVSVSVRIAVEFVVQAFGLVGIPKKPNFVDKIFKA